MAGSGKTTLARQLAALLHAPYFELDVVGYENGAGGQRPLEARQRDLAHIVAQPAWVTEGMFIWWIDELLRHADVIVWLDLHWLRCYWRIIKRHIAADLSRTNRHPGYLKLLRFASWVRPYYQSKEIRTPSSPMDDGANRITTAHVLSRYPNKVIVCRSPADVKRFVAKMQDALQAALQNTVAQPT